jgi:hypothetical protein
LRSKFIFRCSPLALTSKLVQGVQL